MDSENEIKSNPGPWKCVAPTGPILRPAEAAKYLGMSVPTFYYLAARGDLPSPVKIGTRIAGVPQPWLDAVIADRVLNAVGAGH